MPWEYVRERRKDGDKREPPIQVRRRPERRWNPDPNLYQVRTRQPSRRAPAPPKRTQVKDSNRAPQEFSYIKKIGEGGQGRCDLFKRASDGKLFVYKLMKCDVNVDERKKPVEAKIMMDILGKHSCIIDMFFWSWSPTQTIFYLEYCSLGDLSHLIKAYHSNRIALPERFIWHTYVHLVTALAWMHEGYDQSRSFKLKSAFQPIVHRDIKPHNIFLRKKPGAYYPDVVLADFGLATTKLRSCFEPRDLCGSPPYQGPEIPLHSREGDCWAVGACLHQMTIGCPPLAPTPYGVNHDDWTERPEARRVIEVTTRGYTQDLEDAMYKVLRTDPAKRLIGRDLVKSVIRRSKDAGGEYLPLAPWALPG
ncbi:MAG: hypothetical protein Q9191_004472 [Dirinaria sp. TL-2023a]